MTDKAALDVPAHPEGVKDDAKRSIVELVEMHKRLLIALEVRGRGEFVDYERYYHDWSNTVLNAMTVIGNLSFLSHPEPVAQEAVDRLWDRPIMELAMVKAGHFFDVTAKQGKIGETREAYIASNWSHWREDAIAEVAALSGLAHPSPSPEQGEDCPVCLIAFKAGDICASDIGLGMCHAACLEGSPIVDLETGDPVDGPLVTYRYDSAEASLNDAKWLLKVFADQAGTHSAKVFDDMFIDDYERTPGNKWVSFAGITVGQLRAAARFLAQEEAR